MALQSSSHPQSVRAAVTPGPAAGARWRSGSGTGSSTGAGLLSAQGVAGGEGGGQRLFVGQGVHARGMEISDCEALLVDGTLEGAPDKPFGARRLHIGETGCLRGCAQVETAEIHGRFEGQLVVREKLVVFPKGLVTGQVRYGVLVIEEGGQLSGEIVVMQAPGSPQEPSTEIGQG